MAPGRIVHDMDAMIPLRARWLAVRRFPRARVEQHFGIDINNCFDNQNLRD